MKIIDILNSKNVTLSFEVFPPKTAAAVPAAEKAALDIAALRPDFMSVTYGAGGGTSDFTVHIAENQRRRRRGSHAPFDLHIEYKGKSPHYAGKFP